MILCRNYTKYNSVFLTSVRQVNTILSCELFVLFPVNITFVKNLNYNIQYFLLDLILGYVSNIRYMIIPIIRTNGKSCPRL